ncbi:MAG: malto-oligosyltrehalose trehalohydrolase [Acidobacteria bacterium 13_1_40CM_65_14]|nr:MAG: malto-oligosyltrehalose trehalohydrolase [Acidobacteria bacterium 13_1_40CM_65_14]
MTGSAVSSSSALPAAPRAVTRRFPIGAEYLGRDKTHVRVWAPAADRVEVVLQSGDATSLDAEDGGYFSGLLVAAAGMRYQFRLDTADRLLPDPVSRFQPEGPNGPSEIVDPRAFTWTDDEWTGARREGQVVYELHVGTFTREGTWAAAARELNELARIGITMIEVMPIADFEGRFGWGYDGVDLFAPSHLYGRPNDFRRFVDAAHAAGIAVMLDVVYNHLGPVGNYLRLFSPAYFTDKYENEWGDAINFDGPDAGPVREFFETNARYWIDEFHLDGLRLDATQQIFDESPENILSVIGRAVREAAGKRSVVLVAENEPQDTRLVRPIEEGGYGLDALWNDDFHHSAMVALTGHGEAYYTDTRGEPQEFISAAKYGYLFQGQHYHWQRQPRGTPSWGLPPSAFVAYLQNHDQVANSARGRRGHELTSPGRWRAMTALLLLMPETPMLFQGQEFASSAPFLYFADFEPELAAAVRKGRGEFLTQFKSIADFERRATLDDPGDPVTFERCKLDVRERETHAHAYALHADLLRLRRESAAFGEPRLGSVDGAVLSPSAFTLRFFTPDHSDDHVLVVNLGADLRRDSFAEPLLAPPVGTDWRLLWSSEDPVYGGGGMPEVFPDECWRIPGESAIVLSPGPRRQHRPWPKVRRTA